MQEAAAAALGLRPARGRGRLDRRDRRARCPGERIAAAVPALVGGARRRRRDALRARRSARPTRSTSTRAAGRRCRREPSALAAQCKGAGMISPRFATMLCFVQTDARARRRDAPTRCSARPCRRSFDRISVDGQLSTNDTVILMASGASGVRVEPESDDERRFGEALDALLRAARAADRRRRRGGAADRPRARARRRRGRRSSASRARSRTRRWSRPRCSAATRTGGASRRRSARRCPAARRSPSTSRSRAITVAPRAARRSPFDARRARSAPSAAMRSSTRSACAGDGRARPRCSSPTSATTT